VEVDDTTWTYEEICDMEFRTMAPSDCYTKDELTGLYSDLRDSEAGLRYIYDNGVDLKVSGIIRPNEEAVSAMLTGSIGYTSELTKYLIEHSEDSEAIQAQLDNPEIDIFTGLPFQENTGNLTDEEKETEFRHYIEELDMAGQAAAYVSIMSIPPQAEVDAVVEQTMGNMARADIEESLIMALTQQMGMNESDVKDYITAMSDEELEEIYAQMIQEQYRMQYAAQVQAQMQGMDVQQLAGALQMALPTYTTEQCVIYYDEVLVFSDSSYDSNLRELGYVHLDEPSTINLYASSFENKDVIEEAIADYNEGVEELSKITYTDYVGLMMSSVTTIINAISYVLIAFVSISLIVSSIMIGVITLISVQERTKEIGILRAIGASKKNVSRMFNAETMIIGFSAGLLGVVVTYLLCIPINAILHSVTGIPNLNAILPLNVAVVLVLISVGLTLFAGIIPSRSAAKKDPVVALRSE